MIETRNEARDYHAPLAEDIKHNRLAPSTETIVRGSVIGLDGTKVAADLSSGIRRRVEAEQLRKVSPKQLEQNRAAAKREEAKAQAAIEAAMRKHIEPLEKKRAEASQAAMNSEAAIVEYNATVAIFNRFATPHVEAALQLLDIPTQF